MSQITHRNATAGHTGEDMAKILAGAESLCRAVAGRDFGESPLYVVRQSTLPADHYAGLHHYAFTTPSLDLYLREHIPDYRGRGPCVVVNDVALAEDFDPLDWDYVVPAHLLHEAAHILDRPALVADRTGVDPNKLLFESLLIADATKRPPPADLPAYYGHEASFIRIVLHLCHRAERSGVSIAPAAICAGRRYGLSHASDYQDALGDEPIRGANMLFREIAAMDPPHEFVRLCRDDLVAYHQRFSNRGVFA